MRSTSAAALRSSAALLAVLAAALLAGCGGGSGSGTGGARSVTIADYAYEPADLTVPAGTKVTFANRDSTPHTATSKQRGAFDSGSIDTGQARGVILKDAGTFEYYCAFHPFMKGTITVE